MIEAEAANVTRIGSGTLAEMVTQLHHRIQCDQAPGVLLTTPAADVEALVQVITDRVLEALAKR